MERETWPAWHLREGYILKFLPCPPTLKADCDNRRLFLFRCQVHPENDHSLPSIAAGSSFNKCLPELLHALYAWLSVWLNIPRATVKVYKDSNHSILRPGKSQRTIHTLHISVRTREQKPSEVQKSKASLGFPAFLLMLVTGISPSYRGSDSVLQKSQCGQAKSTQGIHELQIVSNWLISSYTDTVLNAWLFRVSVATLEMKKSCFHLPVLIPQKNIVPLLVFLLHITAPLPL